MNIDVLHPPDGQPLSESDHAQRRQHLLAEIERPERSPMLRRRGVVAIAVLAVLAVTGTAVGVSLDLLTQQKRAEQIDPNGPKPVGPHVQIAGGADWALIAWKSDRGLCLAFDVPGNWTSGCGFPVAGAISPTDTAEAANVVAGLSATGLSAGGRVFAAGVTDATVARVDVELTDGSVLHAQMYPARPEFGTVRFFLVRASLEQANRSRAGAVQAFRAYDAAGRLRQQVAG
jgi:hypothetical protein